jgi:anti-anti-sigma factor
MKNIPYIKVDGKNNVYDVVEFNGDLDKTGLEEVRGEIDLLIENSPKKYIVFDCKNLNFINSEGIGFFLTVHYRLLKKEQTLVLTGINQHVKDVMDVIGAFEIIKYFENMDKFKESLK